ncbi:MAG: O-antigen ligase [Xenococcaceae cyanobacterium MO_188.B32]|nr:O-antigen ligase [Xenococcaceae cyanobacterium MO_188.B32]
MVDISTKFNKTSTLSQFLKVFEPAFTVAALFIFSRGIINLIITNGASQGDKNALTSLSTGNYAIFNGLLMLVYLITFTLLILRWRKVLAVIIKDRYISIYLGIVLLSYFWSDFPQDTLKYGLSGVGCTAFGLYLATRYTPKEQIKILFWTFALMLISSILMAIAIPQYGFMSGAHEGALRGIFTHKNGFGQKMILGVLIFLITALDRRNKNNSWLPWLYVFISIVLIVLSQSGNALLGLVIMLTLFFIARIFRSRYEIMISAFLACAIVGLMAITWLAGHEDVFFAAIGEDATLTGRTVIWQYVWDQIQQRPWLGYGYQGFWHDLDGASAYVNLAFGPYGKNGIPHSHNGFLEILLATGFLGLSVFLIGFVINLVKAIALIRTNRDMETFWPLLYLTYTIVANLVENPLKSLDNMLWVLYSATIFSLITYQSQYLTNNKSSSSD